MIYLVCQDWTNTTNNHAGIKYLCKELEKRHPKDVKCIIIKDYYVVPPKNPILFKLKQIYVTHFAYKRRLMEIGKYLRDHSTKNDTIILMEYLESIYPQLPLAKYIKEHVECKVLCGLAHKVPGDLDRYFDDTQFAEWQKNVDILLTLGSSLSDYFVKRGVSKDRVRTLFHYVDSDYYHADPDKLEVHSPVRVIAMGNQARNVDLLKKIVTDNSNVHFTICQGVQDLSMYFNDSNNVSLIPFVPEAELRQKMVEADISINVMQDTIGSNVIVTSMAMGLAMICSDVGSIRDYCNDSNCIFCKNENPDDFSKAIAEYEADTKKFLSYKKESIRIAQSLSFERFYELLKHL